MSYCAGQAGIHADAAAKDVLGTVGVKTSIMPRTSDDAVANGTRVKEDDGSDKMAKAPAIENQRKRKENGGQFGESEEGEGGKRRRFNAGVSETEIGVILFWQQN